MGARVEYVLTGLLVAAVLAAVVVFRPGVYEAFFPWLTIIAMSSVLLVFALSMGSQLTFTKLSPYIDAAKKALQFVPDMFLVLLVGLGTVSYLYFLRLLMAVKARSTSQHPRAARPRRSRSSRHPSCTTASAPQLACPSSLGFWFGNGRATPANGRMITLYVASELRVLSQAGWRGRQPFSDAMRRRLCS